MAPGRYDTLHRIETHYRRNAMTKREQRLLKRMIDQTLFNAQHATTDRDRMLYRNQHDVLCVLNLAFVDDRVALREQREQRKRTNRKPPDHTEKKTKS